MLQSRLLGLVGLFGIALMEAGVSCAQGSAAKPVRIVTGGAGSGSDYAARLIGQGLTSGSGQTVVIDNRPSGVIPGEIVAKAAPDGYTLLVSGSTLWIGPLLRDATPFDPVNDFASISLVASSPNILVVHPSVPAKSVKELVALARSRPGALNYASASTGSPNHLAAELLKFMAGVDVVRVNYKGAAQALSDVISGQVQLTFASSGSMAGHMTSRRLKALAVTSTQPSTLFPGLQTVAASGLPGYEAVSMTAIFAPAAAAASLVTRLNQDIVRAVGRPEIKDKFFAAGVETIGSSPEQLAAAIKSEMARLGKVIRSAGIRDE